MKYIVLLRMAPLLLLIAMVGLAMMIMLLMPGGGILGVKPAQEDIGSIKDVRGYLRYYVSSAAEYTTYSGSIDPLNVLIFDSIRTKGFSDSKNPISIKSIKASTLLFYEEVTVSQDCSNDDGSTYSCDSSEIVYYSLKEVLDRAGVPEDVRGSLDASRTYYAQVFSEAFKVDYGTAELPPSTWVPFERELAWPTPGLFIMTSGFGERLDPITNQLSLHAGLDVGVRIGTEVVAAMDGEVIFAGDAGTAGNLIVIRHSGGLLTRYMHLSRFKVKQGARVESGQSIAESGNTGRTTGPHLHFEVELDGIPQNPIYYFQR